MLITHTKCTNIIKLAGVIGIIWSELDNKLIFSQIFIFIFAWRFEATSAVNWCSGNKLNGNLKFQFEKQSSKGE